MLLGRENQGPPKRSLLSGAFTDIASSSEILSLAVFGLHYNKPIKGILPSCNSAFHP